MHGLECFFSATTVKHNIEKIMKDEYFVVQDELYEQALAAERQYQLDLPEPDRSVQEAENVLAEHQFEQKVGRIDPGPIRWMTFWANRAGNEEAANRWALM